MKKYSYWALLIAVALGAVLGTTYGHLWGTYDGLNKGVYVESCGFEFVGHFGPFCGVD